MDRVERRQRLIPQHVRRTRLAADRLGIKHMQRTLRDHPQVSRARHSGAVVVRKLEAEVADALVRVEDEDFRALRKLVAERLHDEHCGRRGGGQGGGEFDGQRGGRERDVVAGEDDERGERSGL